MTIDAATSIEKGTAWLKEEDWKSENVVGEKVRNLTPSPSAQRTRKKWQCTLNKLRKTEYWQENLREVMKEICSKEHGLVRVTATLNASPQKILEEIVSQVFLQLLNSERIMISRGQFLLHKTWELKELVRRGKELLQAYFPLPPVETRADFAFLIHFNCLPISGSSSPPNILRQHAERGKVTDADLKWGISLLQQGKLSKGIAEFATKVLALVRNKLSCQKVYNLARKEFTLNFGRVTQCFVHHRCARFLSARYTPVLLHLVARSSIYLEHLKRAQNWEKDPDYPYNTPSLYSLLHAQHYHQRQTLLYEYLWKQPCTSVGDAERRNLLSVEQFTKLSPHLFEDRAWKEKSAQRVAKLLEEQAKPASPRLPPRSFSPPLVEEREEEESVAVLAPPILPHLKNAVEWALSDKERDPFCEAERVTRWFLPNAAENCQYFSEKNPETERPLYADRTPYARKIITLVHTPPRRARNLLAHPSLRKIFSTPTSRGCAMMVEIRKNRDLFGLCGILELGWSEEEEFLRLYHYMWRPPSHSKILADQLPFPEKALTKMRSLFKGEREQHPSGTFHILADHKVAIWDCVNGFWYVIWPSTRDVNKLELDFRSPESMAEGGIWR